MSLACWKEAARTACSGRRYFKGSSRGSPWMFKRCLHRRKLKVGLTLQCSLCPKQAVMNATVSERLKTTETKGFSLVYHPLSTTAAIRGSAPRPVPRPGRPTGPCRRPHSRTYAAGGQHRRAPRWGHPSAVRTRLRRGRRPAAPLVPLVLAVGVPIAAPLPGEAGGSGPALELARGAAGEGRCGERTEGEEARGSRGILPAPPRPPRAPR